MLGTHVRNKKFLKLTNIAIENSITWNKMMVLWNLSMLTGMSLRLSNLCLLNNKKKPIKISIKMHYTNCI